MSGSFIKYAREAARACTDVQKRVALQMATDELQNAFGRFTISCSKEDMIAMNGAWAQVAWAIERLPPLPEAGPNGGKMPVPSKKKLTDAA